jgi:hypothetical protein
MKVKGPTNGAPPVDGVGAPDEIDEVQGLGEAAGSAPVGETAAVGSTAAAGAVDAIAEVAGQLRSGKITVDQAVERLIDDTISRQLGPGKDDLEPKLRELLRSYAESDPFLAARIRRLTLAK